MTSIPIDKRNEPANHAASSTESITSVVTSIVKRVVSIDVYRGLVMCLMLLEMTQLEAFAHSMEGNTFWDFIHFHTSHVEWFGCSLHDLIQPGFSFLVGAALAFSIHSRKKRGQTFSQMLLHAVARSLILICLGIFLRSLGHNGINFTFDDTLTQIGLGYTFLFLIAWLPTAFHYVSIVGVLVGYWLLFVAYPAPGVDFDYAAVGVESDWPHHRSGLEAHWNKNSNAAWAFDTVWMNLFPREEKFTHSSGGYATLSFIPTLGTMLLGLLAGNWLRTIPSAKRRITYFVAAILTCFSLSLLVDYFGWCPIVKRIWTPAWTLYSGAWCFAFLLCFHVVCDLKGWVAWSFPLRVIGANSIAAYFMSWTVVDWFNDNWQRYLGWLVIRFSPETQNLVFGSLTFMAIWLILWWMYRKGILLRI